MQRSGGPDFSFKGFTFFSEGKPRTDFYVAISNTALQFTKEGDRYAASYNVSIRVLADESNQFISEKNWTETVAENDYNATLLRTFHVSPRSFSLEPGRYAVVTEITDEISKRTMQRSGILEVPDFQNLFLSLSNITIGSRFVVRNEQQTLLPNVSPEMSYAGEPQHVYFEVYDKLPGRELALNFKLYQTGRYVTKLFASPYYRGEAPKSLADTLFWTHESTPAASSSSTPVGLQLPMLPVGHYRLELTLRGTGSAASGGERDIRVARTFSLWPYGFPEVVTLDQHIEVLEYIASPDEFDRMIQAQSKEEKRERLAEFWVQHPNREEYYKRVEYANRYFSCLTEGWRSPFGWTYIVVGPPEEIQLSARASERWSYSLGSSRTLQVVFYFRDLVLGDSKCRFATMAIDPVAQRELILRWKKPE